MTPTRVYVYAGSKTKQTQPNPEQIQIEHALHRRQLFRFHPMLRPFARVSVSWIF